MYVLPKLFNISIPEFLILKNELDNDICFMEMLGEIKANTSNFLVLLVIPI